MSRDLTAMSRCMPLLAKLISMHVALFGAAAMNAAYAEDVAPVANQSEGLPVGAAEGRHQPGIGDGGGAANSGAAGMNADKVDAGGGNTAEHGAGSKGASGEEGVGRENAHGDIQVDTERSGTEVGPIDTRITVTGAFGARGLSNERGWKRSKIVRLSKNLRYGRITTRTVERIVRNAIGLAVPRANIEIKRPAGNDTPKSAKPSENSGMGAGGTTLHRQGFVPLQAGGVKTRDLPINTAMNHSIVNGRDMVRPGSGSSAIGGAAKNVAGVIDGYSFRPKRP
jgi:hypothetical protein